MSPASGGAVAGVERASLLEGSAALPLLWCCCCCTLPLSHPSVDPLGLHERRRATN